MERGAGAHSAHLIQTIGKRLGSFAETNQGDKLNEGLIKALTGNDTISARSPFAKQSITFKSFMKPVLLTNFKPTFDTEDQAIVERIRFVPFSSKFVGNPKAPNEKKKDKAKVKRILNEYLDDVLRWMVEGSIRYYKEDLQTPESLEEEKKKYVEEMDPVYQFMTERLTYGDASKGSSLKATECYSSFLIWCSDNQAEKLPNKAFITSLRNKGFVTKIKHGATFIEDCSLNDE